MRKTPRLIVCIAVVITHGLLLWIAVSRSPAARTEPEDEPFGLPIYLTQWPQPNQSASQRVSVKKLVLNARPPQSGSTAISMPGLPEEPTIAPPTDASQSEAEGRPIDWSGEAQRAARRMVESGRALRQFGQSTPDDTDAAKARARREQRAGERRAGLVEMVGPGIERRWISSRCYWEFGRIPELLAGPKPKVNVLHCLVGSASPDGTLFDELKPRYLKRQDPARDVTGAIQTVTDEAAPVR